MNPEMSIEELLDEAEKEANDYHQEYRMVANGRKRGDLDELDDLYAQAQARVDELRKAVANR